MGSAAPWLSEDEEVAWRAFRRMTIAVQAGVVHDLAASGLSEPDYEVIAGPIAPGPGAAGEDHDSR
ncbi:hypothetical protein CTI14_24905 [Methylobacterium radiotolerans]|nr:hypothetical protein CTI14_24905 [Methylobacterium radiotolerans]